MQKLLAVMVALLALFPDPLHAQRPGEPIHNWANMPVHTRGATPSPSQVRDAILNAGAQVTTGDSTWRFEDVEPGQLVGKVRWAAHAAEITITYSAQSFSVAYRGSTNLGYEPDGQTIHPNYNRLVRALVFKIQSTLATVDGDPTRASTVAQPEAPNLPGDSHTIAVTISGPGRSRGWPNLLAEWRIQMTRAVGAAGADLLGVTEGAPAAMGKPGTLVAVRVDHFRYVGAARPYTRPPAFQGKPTNAALGVTVQFYDLMTGDPIGTERSYSASARDGDYAWSTNLQVQGMAQSIMTDWRSSLGAAPAAADTDKAEVAFWESVRNSRNPDELQAYLDQFPKGAFVPLAKARLEALRSGRKQ